MSRNRLLRLLVIFLFTLLCGGCGYALLDGKGPVSDGIASTMTYTFLLMMIVVIPTVIMSVVIPILYRKSNKKAKYDSEWSHSTLIEIIVWGIPIIIIIFLAIEAFKTSYSLDPRKSIAANSSEPTLKIQVVALDWKWLFIYPEEGIATVNELAIPVNKPIEFLITSDAAINSFFIPRLGGQIYAMSGMENRLNLLSTEVGVYKGFSANYSGFGFTGMRFNTYVNDEEQYNKWLEKVRSEGEPLDDARYEKLSQKTRDHGIEYFINSDPLRYKNIIQKYSGLLTKKPSHSNGHGHESTKEGAQKDAHKNDQSKH